MRKKRSDFDEIYARSLYQLKESGLSINEIAFNPNYNTKHVTPQRISKIIINYKRMIKKEELDKTGSDL